MTTVGQEHMNPQVMLSNPLSIFPDEVQYLLERGAEQRPAPASRHNFAVLVALKSGLKPRSMKRVRNL